MTNLSQEIRELTAALEEIGMPRDRFEEMRRAAILSEIKFLQFAMTQTDRVPAPHGP
jgi:hypothetical protein